jgi:hypothetical protein
MPKRYLCLSRLEEKDDKLQWLNWEQACEGYVSVLYKRGSEYGERTTTTTATTANAAQGAAESNEKNNAKDGIQKRRLVPVGYYCDSCGTFMTLERYNELVPSIKEMVELFEAAQQKEQDRKYINNVRSSLYYIELYKRRLETGKHEGTFGRPEGWDMDQYTIENTKRSLNEYSTPGNYYYNWVSPEAQQRMQELMDKHQFKESELYQRWPYSSSETKVLRYIEKLKHQHQLSTMQQQEQQQQ